MHCLKRHSSISTNNTSISFSQSSDTAKSTSNNSNNTSSSLFSLAISKKRKGTFLNSVRVSSHKKRKTSFGVMSSTTHSTSHVVFQNTNSLSVVPADSRTASSLSNLKEVKSKKQGFSTAKRSSGGNSSLWSRVSANRFRKR